MPVHVYKIERLDSDGDPEESYTYQFQSLQGVVVLPSAQVEVLTRRGVDGAGLRDVGTKPAPFNLVAVAFHASFETARDWVDDLKALKAHAYGVRLTKESIDYGTFDVVEVAQAGPPAAIGAAAGSLVENPAVKQRYAITLLYREGP